MISLELSTIQHNQPESARLAQAYEQFIASGGRSTVIPAVWEAPKKGTSLESSFNGRTRDGKFVRTESIRDNMVREAALTMNITQVEKKFGIHHSTLADIAKRMGFEFQRGIKVGDRLPEVKAEDMRLVERITALRDIGLSRTQVMKQVDIGYQKFHRILKDYGIDFPAMPRELRNRKASA